MLTNLFPQIAQQKLFESRYHNLVPWNKIRETPNPSGKNTL